MRKAKGIALVYFMFAMITMCMIISLGVDLGRVQVAKLELRRAADTAARAGVQGLLTDTAVADAKTFAYCNKVDATPLTLLSKDIQVGTWSTATNTFKVVADADITNANAVRVLAHRGTDRGDQIKLSFFQPIATKMGFTGAQVNAEAVAMIVPPISVDQDVQATANPFLAGAPYGREASNINPHNNPDFAGTPTNPKASPQSVNMRIFDNEELTFDNIDGTAKHDPNLSKYNPDGQTGEDGTPADIGHNNLTTSDSNSYGKTMYNQNGIADATIPINALVGIFLDDNDPATTAAPANLDFSTAASRDFSTLKPGLKQIFFIGDGLDSKGNHQKFVAPKGATRLFLATWDFYEWSNNSGYREVKVNRPMQISLVK